MYEIITSLAKKHGLSRAEVMTEIETLFSNMLSKWLRLHVMVFFREDFHLEAVAYNSSGGILLQKQVELSEMKGRKTILRYLEHNLAKAGLLKETAQCKRYEREMRWGEIIGRDREGNFLLETEVVPGKTVSAVCPLNRIGVHERNSASFLTGRRRAFHLRRVEPVFLNGTPRLKVIVDRVSKTLVENLLKNQLGPRADKFQFSCIKRYVGHKSIVLTMKPLPKTAIITVDRELKERVQVRIVKSLQE